MGLRIDNWDPPKKTEKGPYAKDAVPLPEELIDEPDLPEGMNTNQTWPIDVGRINSTQCPYVYEDTGMWLCSRLKHMVDHRCIRKNCEYEIITF